MKFYEYEAVVIGSGCAGYNCADWLYDFGVKNIAVVTEGQNMGTSRNTGSDKQTYYKLSLAGNEGDSVYNMAGTLFSGGGVDGDIALAEAANSARCFMKLANLGVDFPTNEYGEFVGYKTDHDPYSRATSIGPYTSKKMTEVLERSVVGKGIKVLDKCQAIKLLTENGKIVGLLCLDLSGEEAGYIAIKTPCVVMATGGPAAVYFNSVYPESQTGNSSLALDAGAEFSNLCEWQYGLASVDFRWNVSGTYQQVLPRYISVDEKGVEREFLNEYFASPEEVLKNVFLKGYEWPFDVRKIYGSSFVDLLVYQETVVKGRKVYLDFTREPAGLKNGFDKLDKTAYDYLKNSEALIPLPIARLKKMNAGAIELYREHGIDLEKEPLRIAVCAQHCNGGVRVDKDWQTSVKGLYVIGEAAGTFGVFRPGGAALNSCQVGGLRAARHITYFAEKKVTADFLKIAKQAAAELDKLVLQTKGTQSTLLKTRETYQKEMSASFAFLRNPAEMKEAKQRISQRLNDFCSDNRWVERKELAALFKNIDLLKMQEAIALSMLEAAENFGSRGSCFVFDSGDFLDRKPKAENEEGRKYIVTAKKTENGIQTDRTPVRPIPERELWFEKVWNSCKELQRRRGE